MTTYPFEAPLDAIIQDPEPYIDAVFSCLESEFLVLPKGTGFVEYPVFEQGYETLKTLTGGFVRFDPESIFRSLASVPIIMVVLRTMLGFTPPEWGYVTTQRTGVSVTQGFIRSLDRKIRMAPESKISSGGVTKERLKALIQTACQLLSDGAPNLNEDQLHRLDKADTKEGTDSIRNLAGMGVPYSMLLYERLLGIQDRLN